MQAGGFAYVRLHLSAGFILIFPEFYDEPLQFALKEQSLV